MKSNLLVVAFCSMLLCLFCSCKKGDTGPAGAIGPAGLIRPVGTANIIHSPYANVTFTGSGTS